jgi:DNA repair photolyase
MTIRDRRKGRGATHNPANRFAACRTVAEDDGWGSLDAPLPPLPTTVTPERARTIINYNDSPDLPIERTINPYSGCEHGCIYCFARPSHARHGLSPGLDFESKLIYKPEAAALLREELARRGYRPAPIALGANTDGWQPVERDLRVTRAVLEVLAECRHPVSMVTKSSLVERDIDVLGDMARSGLVHVGISIITLERETARLLEPRAASPTRRLETIARLHDAGIPVSVLVAPVIPVLTDHQMEKVMEQAREAGAVDAWYAPLRLPHELKELFEAWLRAHVPDAADRVLARVRDLHGGKLYDSTFQRRMQGAGVFAQLLEQRHRVAYERLGFTPAKELRCDLFRPPAGDQFQLF